MLNANMDAWPHVRHTPPDRKHYPHTFLWDGAFVAIVRAHFGDSRQAACEIEEILKGQNLETGLVPNMKFGPGRNNDPERRTFKNPKKTSDYSQPPLLAHATWEVSQSLEKDEGKKFAERVYPQLLSYYDYLGRTRTDPGSSLIAVTHPHETGRDSGTEFDSHKLRLPQPERGTFLLRGTVDKINTGLDYTSALFINVRHRARNWDVAEARSVFWFKDVMFNAIYAQNLEYMGKLAECVGFVESAPELRKRAQQVESDIINSMWSEKTQAFHGLSKDGRKYKEITVSNLFPIILPHTKQNQVEAVLNLLNSSDWFDTFYPIPSVPVHSKKYDPEFTEARLWRGPVWMNMNW